MLSIPSDCGANIGRFCSLFLEKSTKQWQRNEERRTQRLWLAVSDEFTLCVLRTTHAVAQWLCTVHLLMCMDIEANPGPDESNNILQIMEWKFAQVMYGMQTYTANICRMIEEKWTNIDKSFRDLTAHVGELRQRIEQNKDDIDDLQEDRETILERLDRLEEKIDSTEMETKRNNLKFIGIREPRRGDSYTSVEQQVVDVLNEFSTSPCWHLADVNRAFRVGARQQRSDQPRPLIVQFYRWKDKMAILNDRNLRDKLRRAGIKVTSDLTSRQRDTLDFYRSQGKIAYYRNGRLHFADRLDSFPRSRHHESYSQALRSDGHYLQSDEWPQLPRHRQEEPWSQQRARDHSPRRDAYHRRNAPPRRDGDMASESSQHSAAGNDVPRRRAPGQTRQAGNGPRDQSGNQSSQQYYVSKHAPDLRDTGEEKGDTVSPVTSERGAQPREQRGQNSRRDIDRHGNSAHDNHQDRTSPGEAKGARPRPVAPGTPPYDDVIGSGATPTATEGRKETTDLIQDTPEEDQQTGHMDTQNSNDEDDNNQSIVNDAEDSASNRDCNRGHTEDKEQEEDTTLRQEPGRPSSSQDTYTTRTTSEDTVATERNQASNEQLEATEREVDQGHQPGAESDSKTNGSHGQSQEADVEAIPSPVAQERVSQPASTARTLRSGRDTQKGRSQSQSSIVDSFRRMQSSDRTKDYQARRGGTQDRSASASNR